MPYFRTQPIRSMALRDLMAEPFNPFYTNLELPMQDQPTK